MVEGGSCSYNVMYALAMEAYKQYTEMALESV